MKGKFFNWFRDIKSSFRNIHLVDRCLILFMILLLVQLTFSLFVNNYDNTATNSIDVVIRTSIAGIFGYFLSVNFVNHTTSQHHSTTDTLTQHTDEKKEDDLEMRTQQIGFSSPSKASSSQSKSNKPVVPHTEHRSASGDRLQIIIVTCVGIFCLVVLTVIRNISCFEPHIPVTHGSSATISQFRDIVSGCVGFLIGCPTGKSDS